jgi:cell shape-determining protein MreD
MNFGPVHALRRTIVQIASHLLLWAVIGEINHMLTGVRVYLFAGALYVIHAALFQPRRSGRLGVVLGGLICDATTPVIFGTHAFLFLLAHAVVYRLRDRVPRDDAISCIILALLLNLALFLAFSFTQIHRSPAPAAAWPRLLMDLVCSQFFLVVITPWFLALQSRALVLARVEQTEFAR